MRHRTATLVTLAVSAVLVGLLIASACRRSAGEREHGPESEGHNHHEDAAESGRPEHDERPAEHEHSSEHGRAPAESASRWASGTLIEGVCVPGWQMRLVPFIDGRGVG